MLKKIIRDESGQDLIEYGLLVSFISVAAVTTLSMFRVPINNMYQVVINALS